MGNNTNNKKNAQNYVIRRSPVVLVYKIIIIELLFLVLFIGVSTIFSYFEIEDIFWGPLSALTVINFLIQFINIIIIIIILLAWINRKYIINEDQVIKTRGILRKKTDAFDIGEIQTAKVRQSIPGRLFKYGDIDFQLLFVEEIVKFKYISKPHVVADLCEKLKARHPEGPMTKVAKPHR